MPHKLLSLELPKGESSSKESPPASATGGWECEFLSHFQKSEVGVLGSALGPNPRVHRPPTWGLWPPSSAVPLGYLQPVPVSVLSEMGTQIIFLGVRGLFFANPYPFLWHFSQFWFKFLLQTLSQLLSVHFPGPSAGEIKKEMDTKHISVTSPTWEKSKVA